MTAPALDAYRCLASRAACRLRVSKLTPAGLLQAGAGKQYVSDAVVQLESTPQVVAGTVSQQRNGCGDLVVDVKDPDAVNRAAITAQIATLDPELIAMLTDASLLSHGGVTVGLQERVGEDGDPCLVEIWTKAMQPRQQDSEAGVLTWFHFAFPFTIWNPGQMTLNAGVHVVPLAGDASPNANIGTGPAGDWPGAVTSYRAWWLDSDIPDAHCGRQALVVAGS